jgi:hypothetical protein
MKSDRINVSQTRLHYYEAGMGKTYHLLFMPTAVVFFTGGCVSVAANWLAG